MATSIQNIETPKHARALDTSSNNNHGQIYSGRALEFDGVTDYLTTGWGNGDISTPFTIACWVYVNTAGDHIFFGQRWTSTNKRIYIGIRGTPSVFDMGIQGSAWNNHSVGGGPPAHNVEQTGFTDQPRCHLNTWYRVVLILDGSIASMYVNGIKSYAKHHTAFTSDGDFYIGDKYSDVSYRWDGMLSDLQLYNAAWSADDVTYDYLNPESIVLNRSGTSITESNLKMWYPMQDGHRGNQSYVLDASNAGLQDYFSDDFSTDTKDDYNSDNGAPITYDSGSKSIRHTYTRESGVGLKRNSTMVAYGTYKATFKARGTRTHNFTSIGTAGVDGVIKNPTLTSEFQDFEFIFQQDNQGSFRMYQGTGSIDDYLEIKDLVIQSINDKKNATTVFFGDELIADANNRTFASSPDWADSGTTANRWAEDSGEFNNAASSGATTTAITHYDGTTATFSANYLKLVATSDTTVRSCELDGAAFETNMVVGRTYRVSYAFEITGYSTGVLTIGFGADDETMDTSSSRTHNSNTAPRTEFFDFVYKGTTTHAALLIQASGSGHAFTVYFDNFTLKEVGTATGWTDADQQLHIPQTALQSYNELAWFDGYGDSVTIADDPNFSFGNSTADSAMSVSAWIFMNDATSFSIVSKDTDNTHKEWEFKTGTGDKLTFIVWDATNESSKGRKCDTSLSSLGYEGQWIHVAASYNGDQTDPAGNIQIFINGERVDDANNNSEIDNYAAMENTTAVVSIGKHVRESTFAEGCITEVSIWSYALSMADVQELYNDGKALDALTHSAVTSIKGYWRNNGLSTWTNLISANSLNSQSPGAHDGTPSSLTETMFISEGVDSSRDSQGLVMNRQKNTSSLNVINKAGLATNVNDRVEVGPFTDLIADGATAASVECWVKANGTEGSDDYCTFAGERTSKNILLCGRTATGRPEALYRLTTGGNSNSVSGDILQSTSVNVFDGDWHHIVFTFQADDRKGRLYVNGSLHDTTTSDHSGDTLDNDAALFYVGGGDGGQARNFNGMVDSVKVYSDALSETEALTNYNATKSSHTN